MDVFDLNNLNELYILYEKMFIDIYMDYCL